MAYGRNTFIDPAGVRADYAWQVNHSEESEQGRERQATNTPTTDGTGRVVQQGDEGPLILEYTGTILHQAQFDEMRAWYDLSRQRTLYFRDFAGDEYEVLILTFKPLRHRTIANPRDSSINLHYWTYTLRMQVINVRAGVWLGTSA